MLRLIEALMGEDAHQPSTNKISSLTFTLPSIALIPAVRVLAVGKRVYSTSAVTATDGGGWDAWSEEKVHAVCRLVGSMRHMALCAELVK